MGPNCPPEAYSIDITPYIDIILDTHNTLRNRIASGNVKGYEPACNMATMTWNKELAKLAQCNANTCIFDHDCHNTDTYIYSGQNLGYNSSSRNYKKEDVIPTIIRGWFKEKDLTDMSQIDNYTGIDG